MASLLVTMARAALLAAGDESGGPLASYR